MEQPTLAEKIIAFNENLHCGKRLPQGFAIMNPFSENPESLSAMSQFYRKFYDDHKSRKFIIGINPGRFGAGITGVPFTDPKNLKKFCGIPFSGKEHYEPSANFVYKMIAAYGGVHEFYRDFYIHSIFPLAIIRKNEKGNYVNCNYYDDKRLIDLLKSSMVKHLEDQIKMGLKTDVAFIWGKKNAKFIKAINKEKKLFDRLEVLDHPRYIQQYKSKEIDSYTKNFVSVLKEDYRIY